VNPATGNVLGEDDRKIEGWSPSRASGHGLGWSWRRGTARTGKEGRWCVTARYRLAREAKTETDRLASLDLAESWLEAASREVSCERIAEAQKLAREWRPKPER
jgi:hypothetical protein